MVGQWQKEEMRYRAHAATLYDQPQLQSLVAPCVLVYMYLWFSKHNAQASPPALQYAFGQFLHSS